MRADSLLLVLDSLVDVLLELVFEGVLSAGSDGLILDFLLEAPSEKGLLVVGFVNEKLVRVVVQRGELHFSVHLVGKSSLGVELAQLDWSLAPKWHGIGFSQSHQE